MISEDESPCILNLVIDGVFSASRSGCFASGEEPPHFIR